MTLHFTFDVTAAEEETLKARAHKAGLPLSSYVLAAALNPGKFSSDANSAIPVIVDEAK